jgi:hypothetical protein
MKAALGACPVHQGVALLRHLHTDLSSAVLVRCYPVLLLLLLLLLLLTDPDKLIKGDSGEADATQRSTHPPWRGNCQLRHCLLAGWCVTA